MEATDDSVAPTHVRCPHCKRVTDHIPSYRHPFVVFGLVFFSIDVKGQTVFGCPKCVRAVLFEHALVSLLIANVLCWIPLPVIVHHIQTSHADTRPGIPPEYWYLARLPPPNRAARALEARGGRSGWWSSCSSSPRRWCS